MKIEKWIANIVACAPLFILAIKQCVIEGMGYTLEEAQIVLKA
jgi:hypothetical protein